MEISAQKKTLKAKAQDSPDPKDYDTKDYQSVIQSEHSIDTIPKVDSPNLISKQHK